MIQYLYVRDINENSGRAAGDLILVRDNISGPSYFLSSNLFQNVGNISGLD